MPETNAISEETTTDHLDEVGKPNPNPQSNSYLPFSREEEAAMILLSLLPDDDPFD